MGPSGGGARGRNVVWRWRWLLLTFCLIIAGCAETFPTTLQDNGNSADKDGLSADAQTSDLLNANANETASSSNAVKQESDSSEKHVGFPSAEVSEAPPLDQDASDAANGNERAPRLDYYDDMQLPRDPEEDDAPVLPEHAVNVNEDYAGIYDYRGSPDGRYRRKRTLTTNIEQLITRSSRLNRMRRSVSDNSLLDMTSPGERAEKLVSLMRVLQDADPAFDANDFLKDLVLSDDSNISSNREQAPKPSLTSSKDFSRLFAIAAMMAQQQEDPAGIAM